MALDYIWICIIEVQSICLCRMSTRIILLKDQPLSISSVGSLGTICCSISSIGELEKIADRDNTPKTVSFKSRIFDLSVHMSFDHSLSIFYVIDVWKQVRTIHYSWKRIIELWNSCLCRMATLISLMKDQSLATLFNGSFGIMLSSNIFLYLATVNVQIHLITRQRR